MMQGPQIGFHSPELTDRMNKDRLGVEKAEWALGAAKLELQQRRVLKLVDAHQEGRITPEGIIPKEGDTMPEEPDTVDVHIGDKTSHHYPPKPDPATPDPVKKTLFKKLLPYGLALATGGALTGGTLLLNHLLNKPDTPVVSPADPIKDADTRSGLDFIE